MINGSKTQIKAEGTPGETPTVEIDEDDGYWVINGTKTDVKAEGANGDKGKDAFLVVFDSDGGTPAISAVPVSAGGKVQEPTPPVKAYAGDAGLYTASGTYQFAGWYDKDGAPFTAFPITVTENITLTARWITPVPLNVSAQAGANIVEKAIDYAMNQSTSTMYTLLLNEDVECGPMVFENKMLKFKIIGIGGSERKITLNQAAASLFTVGTAAPSVTGIELTIGNNITLVGTPEVNTMSLVRLAYGGTFVMLEGSKITGCTSSETGGRPGPAVHVGTGGTFTMKGGIITGNTSTGTSPRASGGVRVSGIGNFNMEGGSIYGNDGRCGDVMLAISSAAGAPNGPGTFALSGNATIGTLTFGADDPAGDDPDLGVLSFKAAVSPDWIGSVGALNLFGEDPVINVVINTYWENKVVLEPAANLTPTILSKFTLGKFLASGSAAPYLDQPITGNTGGGLRNFRIENAGSDIGKLLAATP